MAVPSVLRAARWLADRQDGRRTVPERQARARAPCRGCLATDWNDRTRANLETIHARYVAEAARSTGADRCQRPTRAIRANAPPGVAGSRGLSDGDIRDGDRKHDHRDRNAHHRQRLGGFDLFSWVFTIFLLTQAVSIPIYGRLADMFGRKRVFFIGIGLFLTGAMLCGFAWGMVPLICFRAIQGLGAGAVQPITATILGDIYTPSERAHVQGLVSSVFGVSAVVGPSLGAFLIAHVSWSIGILGQRADRG